MRVTETRAGTDTSAGSFLELLDDFAALRTYGPAGATVGGYRIPGAPRPPAQAQPSELIETLARARVRVAALLFVALVGGLGIAIVGRPAACRHCNDAPNVASPAQASLEEQAVSRFDYARPSALRESPAGILAQAVGTNRQMPEHDSGDLAVLSVAALVEPEEPVGASPISTSATGPLHEAAVPVASEPPRYIGRLPVKIEEVSDTPPQTIALAAAPMVDVSGVPEPSPPPPVILAATAPASDVTAVEAAPELPIESQHDHRHIFAKHKANLSHALRAHSALLAQKAITVANVPTWALRMFETPWQRRAFSYQ